MRSWLGFSDCIEKDVCLPLFCNQTMNSYLKQIATLCNIDKNLTTHCQQTERRLHALLVDI